MIVSSTWVSFVRPAISLCGCHAARRGGFAWGAGLCAGPLLETLFDQLGVGQGTRLLDIARGSGYAAAVAAGRGAQVSGLDAPQALTSIARARTPEADFRVGDLFELPFGEYAITTQNNHIVPCSQSAPRGRGQFGLL